MRARKLSTWLRHLVRTWLPAAGQRTPNHARRRWSQFGRAAALAPARDEYIEPAIAGLLSELIARENQLRRQLNVGMKADELTLKAETIDWLRRARSLSRSQHPKIIPDLDTDVNLYRMLISHRLSDLKYIEGNRLTATRSRATACGSGATSRRLRHLPSASAVWNDLDWAG
jgi:hypothetical protein